MKKWFLTFNNKGSGEGNYYDQEAYWLNPQYLLNLSSNNKADNKVSLIISLMQTEQVRKRTETDGTYANSNEPMAFAIYFINEKNLNIKILNNQKFTNHELKKVGASGEYQMQREVTKRFDLAAGSYVIIPSLSRKNKRMKFILRVYVEGDHADNLDVHGSGLDRLISESLIPKEKKKKTKEPKELKYGEINDMNKSNTCLIV